MYSLASAPEIKGIDLGKKSKEHLKTDMRMKDIKEQTT
jgi:hypothetical protein